MQTIPKPEKQEDQITVCQKKRQGPACTRMMRRADCGEVKELFMTRST